MNMKRYILTGTPGSGKTSLIRALEIQGASIVAEAATDIIAYQQMQGDLAPWEKPDFIDDIIRLQKHRQMERCGDYSDLYFYDRSPICTYALAVYLGFEPSVDLINEIERIRIHHIYEKRVFFVENLGFITKTHARTISFEDSLRFEQMHLDAYKRFDYKCLRVPAAPIMERVRMILRSI
jgi:predicted ATPase